MYYKILENVIDFVFIVDIALLFVCSIRNERGNEVFDTTQIAKNYIGSLGFLFDFLSVCGSNFISKTF